MGFSPQDNTNNVNTSASPDLGTPTQDKVFYNERTYTDQLAQQTRGAAESLETSAETDDLVKYESPGGPQSDSITVEPNAPPPSEPASVVVEVSEETTEEGSNPAGSPFSRDAASEPIAVFNQKVTDFLQDSRAVAALEKAYVESKISDKFVERILANAKEGDNEVFSSAMTVVDTELRKAGNVLDALMQILKTIRDFDKELTVTNDSVIRNMCLQHVSDESIKLDELLPETDVFGNLLRINDQHFFDQNDNLPAMPVTALSKTALSAVRFYLDKGYMPSQLMKQKILSLTSAQLTEVVPGVVISADETGTAVPSVKSAGERVSSVGTPFDQQASISEKDNAGIGTFCDNPIFSAVQSHANTNLKTASVLLSIAANEMLISAGLGRLEGTTLGNKFSTTSNFRKNLLGVSPTGTNIISNHPEPGSIASTLLADEAHGVTPNISLSRAKMILDRKARDQVGHHYDNASATSGFTKTAITDPVNNKLNLYEDALDNADEIATVGVQFFEKLQARDKDISILTPKKLFVRVMEEINTSISDFVVGFESASKTRCAELAMYSLVGGRAINPDERDYTEKMRTLLFSAMTRQCFSILQKQNIKILANASESGKPKITEVTVKDEDGTSVTKTITTKDKTGTVDTNKVVLDASVIRFSGDDTQHFVKTSAVPSTSFLGARFAGDEIPENIKIHWDNIGNPNDPNDAVQAADEKTATASGQDLGPGVGGAVGMALEEPKVSSAEEVNKTEGSGLKTVFLAGTNVLWNTKIFDLFVDLEQDANSLTSRLAKVFVECHEEAQKIARSEDDTKNFIVPSARVTKASGIDGSTLVSMIFHAATKLAFVFSDSTIIKPQEAQNIQIDEAAVFVWPEGEVGFHPDVTDPVALLESVTKGGFDDIKDAMAGGQLPQAYYKGWMLEQYYNYITGLRDDYALADIFGFFFDGNTGQLSEWWKDTTVSAQGKFGFSNSNVNKRIHEALAVILAASKSNDLESVYDNEGKIIGIGESNKIVSSRDSVTYKQLEDLIKDLSRSHRQPYAALLSHLSQTRYVKEKAADVISLGKQLRSDTGVTQSETVKSFLEFYNNFEFGKAYVENVNDYRLQITFDKIKNIQRERSLPALKRQKITKGELNSLKPIFDILGSFNVSPGHPKDFLIVCVGIPTGYTEDVAEHSFDLIEGLSSANKIPIVNFDLARISGFEAGQPEDFKGKQSFSFLLESILSSESFAPFENFHPGTMGELEEKILVNVGKENQSTGLEWINQWNNNQSKRTKAQYLLRNEIKSFLMKRFLSILSPVDLDVRDMVPGLDSRFQNADTPRYTGSKELAKALSLVAGYPPNTFDGVFQEQGGGVVTLDPIQMQQLTSYHSTTTSTGQLTHFPKISYAFADLFTDVFSALPFRAGYLMNEIFAPNDYEKIVCFEVDKNNFLLAGGVYDNAIPKSPNSTVDPGFVGFHTYALLPGGFEIDLPKP